MARTTGASELVAPRKRTRSAPTITPAHTHTQHTPYPRARRNRALENYVQRRADKLRGNAKTKGAGSTEPGGSDATI